MTKLDQSANQDFVDYNSIAAVLDQVREIYLADSRPWVIGYSGGKDSTCALQLVLVGGCRPQDNRAEKTCLRA